VVGQTSRSARGLQAPLPALAIALGGTTYTLEYGVFPTAANQVLVCGASCGTGLGAAALEQISAADIEAVINNNPSLCGFTNCVYSGQTANSSASGTLVQATITLGALTNGGTFALSSSQSGLTATTSASSGGIAFISVSGLGGYANGIPTTCSLTGGGGSGATCSGVGAGTGATVAPTGYAPAWYATPGWDFATGLGSVNAYNLVYNTAW
jgi:hypothetical protein